MATTTIRHPVELLEAFEENFNVTSKISSKTTKKELKSIKENFKRKIERMRIIWDRSMKAHAITGSEADTFTIEFQAVRKDLCMQLLTTDYMNRYADEFERVSGSGDFFKLLESIIGTVSEKDEKNEAETKLQEISRWANEQETFVRFYDRIEFLADKASGGNRDLKSYFLKKAFNSNLSPEIKRYLTDHDKSQATTREKAVFLDKREKYKKKPEINAISTSEIFQIQMEELTSQISRQFSDLKNEICEIKKVSADSKDTSRSRSKEQSRHIEDTAKFLADGEKRSKKERCAKCGFFNHATEDCRGTSTRKCHLCNEIGHLMAVCPLKARLLSKN